MDNNNQSQNLGSTSSPETLNNGNAASVNRDVKTNGYDQVSQFMNNNIGTDVVTKENNMVKNQVITERTNQFINPVKINNENKLSDLNVNGEYNNLNKDEYKNVVNTQPVKTSQKKKVTITITKEMKVFLILIAVMFVFVILMPSIFDLIQNIKW